MAWPLYWISLKIYQLVQKLMRGQTHRQEGDLISVFIFLQEGK
jgi:hypothetical protein